MKRLVEFFVNNSLLVNLISVIVIIVGILSLISLKKDVFPNVQFDMVSIITPYPGTTPEDVEKLVTIELEREIKSVDGITEINAVSLEGQSMVFLKLDPDYNGKDVLTDIKDVVDSVTDFPEEVGTPVIRMARHNRSILKIALTGENEDKLREAAKNLRDQIETVPGVAKIEFSGYRREEIVVEVFPEKLNRYQVTVDEVAQAIKGRNMNLSGGKLETSGAEFLIRTRGEFQDIRDIENVVVRSNNTGANVKITQLGRVSRALSTSSVFHRAQGRNAIYLNVRKKFAADVIKTTNKTKKIIEDFFTHQSNQEMGHVIVDELAYYVKRRLGVLTSNGFFGLALVLGVLLLFLNFRVSIITSLGAPIAFLTAFALMDAMGISINLISMFGLILVLGMLVDDAIIVSEHFYQHVEEGMEPRKAAVIASVETVKPVTATIVTTILAFGSIFFMGGIMGKFLWPVPAVVIICLIASWLECFFILPSHLADFVKGGKNLRKKRRWYDPMRDFYMKVLNVCIKRYILTFVASIGILIGSLFLAKTMDFELFPGDDVRVVTMELKGKVGDPVTQTEQAVIKAEKIIEKILRKDEVKAIRGIAGTQAGTVIRRPNSRTGSHYGGFIIYLTAPTERERSTDEILNEVAKAIKKSLPDYDMVTEKLAGGPPKGSPIEVQLKSDSLEDLKVASREIIDLLKTTKGVTSADRDFEEGKTQIIVDVDEVEAKRLGLSTAQVALAVRKAYAGDSITKIRESDEDIEVILKLDKNSRSQIDVLKKLYLLNKQGRSIQLSRVAKIEKEIGAFVIRRLDRKRAILVKGDIDRKQITPIAAAKKLRPQIQEVVQKYPSMGFIMGGENKDTQDSMVRLGRAGVLSLGAIFIVLVAIFSSLGQPLVILSAIPLGLIGVILTFKLMGLSLGFMAMMGVIGLVGVVVNDSIVLVNFINKKRDAGAEIIVAITEAARSRFRPIILTTFTTVASLLPIAHASGGDPFLKPMAISFAWGLMFSTLVTLLFIPCAYLIYYKLSYPFLRSGRS